MKRMLSQKERNESEVLAWRRAPFCKENNTIIEKAHRKELSIDLIFVYWFDSRSSRAYCDNATKAMCVANVIFGQERLTEQFLSMCFFYDSVTLFTKRCSSPTEHFTFIALFLWEHSSLCAPEGAESVELRLVRTVGMVRLTRFSLKL